MYNFYEAEYSNYNEINAFSIRKKTPIPFFHNKVTLTPPLPLLPPTGKDNSRTKLQCCALLIIGSTDLVVNQSHCPLVSLYNHFRISSTHCIHMEMYIHQMALLFIWYVLVFDKDTYSLMTINRNKSHYFIIIHKLLS